MTGLVTIPQGSRALRWNLRGEVWTVDGPRRFFAYRERIEGLQRYAAGPDQYLVVRRLDGNTEHLPGPATLWFHPLEHAGIGIEPAVKLDANEALVVYHRDGTNVRRRVVRGPALFVPRADEWIHHFSWHGTDPRNGHRKIPSALQFEKLRVIPDQMYFDVESVRTGDDALLVVKVMVFFELCDIERMLDQTHDPIADIINALSADVIDFVGAISFDTFKTRTEALNDLATYTQLLQRAEKIGYRISKVVYRGYYASEKLQAMHDDAIECRTRLRLESETERQAQELADMKQAREQDRADRQQKMDEAEGRHQIRLKQMSHQAELELNEALHKQEWEAKRQDAELAATTKARQLEVERHHEQASQELRAAYFGQLHGLQVDLTRYLVAQYQHPDKIIRIDGQQKPQLHLHEV
jgi:hypothetical protein